MRRGGCVEAEGGGGGESEGDKRVASLVVALLVEQPTVKCPGNRVLVDGALV